MKRMFYVHTQNGGTVVDGLPVTTTQPWGAQVAPYIRLGYWYKHKTGDNSYEWRLSGSVVNIDRGIELSVGTDGDLVARTGVVKRELDGLWLRRNDEPVSETEAVLWFQNSGRDHSFSSHNVAAPSAEFSVTNLDVHYHEAGCHLLADVRNGSTIKLTETRDVRIAGTGKRFLNFSKTRSESEVVDTLIVNGLNQEALLKALRDNRATSLVPVEMYNLTGNRHVITVPSDIKFEALQARAKNEGYSRFERIATNP